MKKLILFFIPLVIFVACKSTQSYTSPQAAGAVLLHKKVAVLPFRVTFSDDYKEVIRGGKSSWAEQERIAGLDLQKAGFEYVAKRSNKKGYDLAIQSFFETNKILEDSNISFSQLMLMDKTQLANLLGVDAVIFGTSKVDFDLRLGYTGNNGIITTMELYDAGLNEKIWSMDDREYIRSRMDSPQDLAKRSVSQLVDALPYKSAGKK